MHLLDASGGATRMADRALSLITSYENGSVKLWRYRNIGKERSIEGLGWECLWSFKLHVESGKRSVICRACWMLLSTHIFAQPRRQSWQQRFHSTVLSPSRCQQTTLLEDTISTKYVLDSHVISTAIKKREPNKRTPGGSNFELGDHRNGVPNKAPRKWRGGVPRRWTGMCHWRLGRSVRSPLTFFMIGFSTDDRTSSFEKNPVTMKKNFDAKNKYSRLS